MSELVYNFKGKNFVVVGASSGIGRQIAIDLVSQGGCVLTIARRKEKLLEIKNQYPDSVEVAVLDVESAGEKDWNEVIGDFVKSRGKIRGGVYTSGISGNTTLKYFDKELAHRIMEVSFWGMVDFVQCVSKNRVSEKNLSLVAMSSIASYTGEKSLFAYSAAKAAVRTGVKSIAREISSTGRRINTISPGWIAGTEMTETANGIESDVQGLMASYSLLGLGKVTDVSSMTMYLLSDASRYITGADFVVDGGLLLGNR